MNLWGISWVKENIILILKVDLTNLKVRFIFVPLYFLLQIIVYLYFKDSLAQNGFWVIFIPMLATLIFALIYLIPKRNNPNYLIYYLFHLSNISKIIILVAVLFLIGLYFYAQCRDYGFSVGIACFQRIFQF